MLNKDELLYAEPTHRIIAFGTYKERKWVILSNGDFPLAYVSCNELKGKHPYEIYLDNAYRGVTFSEKCYWNEMDSDNYIGWDYAHCFDYTTISEEGTKHTFDEILGCVKNVINELNEGGNK